MPKKSLQSSDFSPKIYRINAEVLEEKQNRVFTFDDFSLNADEHLLMRGTERLSLSPRTFALLVKLVENAGHLLEKETLMKEVWVEVGFEAANFADDYRNLRKALGEKGEVIAGIETVPRVGYRFIAPVEISTGDVSSASVKSPAAAP